VLGSPQNAKRTSRQPQGRAGKGTRDGRYRGLEPGRRRARCWKAPPGPEQLSLFRTTGETFGRLIAAVKQSRSVPKKRARGLVILYRALDSQVAAERKEALA